MRCPPVLSLLLLAIILSGCTSAGDPPLEPSQDREDDPPPDEEPGRDEEPPAPWIARFEHDGSVDSHLCIDIIFCTVFSDGDGTLQISFDNATIVRLELMVEWDEQSGSGEDRVLTVDCWDQEGGDCTDFPGPLQERGGAPLALTADDLQVPPETTLNLTVTLVDQAPDPLVYRYDEVVEFLLTGEALLEPARTEDVE